jgi:hypothetical protein
MTAEQRRALTLLASDQHGATEALMLAHCFKRETLAGLVQAGLAEAVGAPTKRKLRFGWAAHGNVSSSPWVFEKASGIVLQLLTMPSAGPDDQVHGLFG